MSMPDIIIIAAAAILAGTGFYFGVIRMGFAVFGLAAAYFTSSYYGSTIAANRFSNHIAARILGYLIIFFIVAFIMFLLGKLVSKTAHLFFLGLPDRFIGAGLMLLLAFFILWILLGGEGSALPSYLSNSTIAATLNRPTPAP